jgi:hypothetical protein
MEKVFAANPNADKLLVFKDGTCFLNDKVGENNAINYARQTNSSYEIVARPVVKEAKEEVKEEKPTNKKK